MIPKVPDGRQLPRIQARRVGRLADDASRKDRVPKKIRREQQTIEILHFSSSLPLKALGPIALFSKQQL